jgi:hypothetical protein
MPRRLRALVSVAIVALVACGEERSGEQQQDGRLVVRESLPELPRYIEGSLSNGNCELLDPPADRCEQVMAAHRKDSRWAHEHLPRMSEERARAAAEARGLDLRVVRLDGRGLFHTADRVSTRVNVEVQSGTVIRVVGLY